MTANPLSLVEVDVVTMKATLNGAFAMLARHPAFGSTSVEHGVMLCDVGTILQDAIRRLDGIYDVLDNYEPVPATIAAAQHRQARAYFADPDGTIEA